MATRGERAAPTRLARRARDDAMVVALVALVTLALYALAWQLGPMRTLEGYTLDLRFRLQGPRAPGRDIALVLVDDRSIGELGRWPWNRTVFADAVERLDAAGARVIVFDLLFSEPDTSLPPEVVAAVRGRVGVVPGPGSGAGEGASVIDPGRLDADPHLARTMARAGNVLVPFALAPEGLPPGVVAEPVRASAFRTVRPGPGRPSLVGRGVIAPVPELAQAAAALGHVNVALAPDGAARFAHPVAKVGDIYLPSLAVQATRLFHGYAPEEVRLELGRGLRLGSLEIPTDAAMRTVVRYYGPDGAFPTHSFSDLLRDRVEPGALRGRIVLIGAQAPGISDRFLSPFSPRLSGTERIATVIENLLREEVVVRRAAFWGWDLALALAGGMVLLVLARSLSAYALVAVAGGLLVLVFALDHLALVQGRIWLSLTLPASVLSAICAALLLAHHLHQARLARTIQGAFGRYLHPQLVRSLISTGFETEPGTREATILFADLAGFTSMAEGMAPDKVVSVLNEYFSAVTEPVERHGGLITQYQGDALLAVFNVPFENPDHPGAAARAALELLSIVRERRFGGERLTSRVGVNTGPVVAGSVGSASHVSYTVHGDAVNLAARLEALNTEHGTSLLVSESTAVRLGPEFRCAPVGTLPIRGKQALVGVYEVSEG